MKIYTKVYFKQQNKGCKKKRIRKVEFIPQFKLNNKSQQKKNKIENNITNE